MKITLTYPQGVTEVVADNSCYLDIKVGESVRLLRILSDGRIMDETDEPNKEI